MMYDRDRSLSINTALMYVEPQYSNSLKQCYMIPLVKLLLILVVKAFLITLTPTLSMPILH